LIGKTSIKPSDSNLVGHEVAHGQLNWHGSFYSNLCQGSDVYL